MPNVCFMRLIFLHFFLSNIRLRKYARLLTDPVSGMDWSEYYGQGWSQNVQIITGILVGNDDSNLIAKSMLASSNNLLLSDYWSEYYGQGQSGYQLSASGLDTTRGPGCTRSISSNTRDISYFMSKQSCTILMNIYVILYTPYYFSLNCSLKLKCWIILDNTLHQLPNLELKLTFTQFERSTILLNAGL